MATKRQKQLRAIIEQDIERLAEELEDKTLPERRLILEREQVVDLIVALLDMRSTACSRFFGQRRRKGQRAELPIPCEDGKRRWKKWENCSVEQIEMYEKKEYIPQAKKVVNAYNQMEQTVAPQAGRTATHLYLVEGQER